jgi:hypothetical protein
VPLPATVLTTPPGVTRRIAELPVSVTYRLPPASVSRRLGVLKRASTPLASA